jgi:hypothetical protein
MTRAPWDRTFGSDWTLCCLLGGCDETDVRHSFSKHRPALPLYTEADAILAPEQLSPVAFGQPFGTGSSLRLELQRAGHILGTASVLLLGEGTAWSFPATSGPHAGQ